MTSYDNPSSAGLLPRLLEALAEEPMVAEIDDPVDQAIQAFCHRLPAPGNIRHIHHMLGECFRRLSSAVPPYRQLTEQQAVDEAIWLLERDSDAPAGQGYDYALAEIAETKEDGLITVIQRMGELFKRQHRQMRQRSILIVFEDPASWPFRLQLTREIRPLLQNHLPPRVAAFTDEQMALCMNTMLALHLETQVSKLRQAAGIKVPSH